MILEGMTQIYSAPPCKRGDLVVANGDRQVVGVVTLEGHDRIIVQTAVGLRPVTLWRDSVVRNLTERPA